MEDRSNKQNKMGTMSMGKLLITMSGPAIVSMMINALYNIVDSIFVAQIGEDAFTAVSIVFPVQMLIICVAVGTGIGINSLISRRLGAGKKDEAELAASNGIKLAVLNWVIFSIVGIFFSGPFVKIFSHDANIVSYGTTYLTIVAAGCLFLNTSMIIEKIFQATGNMIVPMITVSISAITNIILDPILIFGLLGFPKLGIAGAAIATVFAQCLGMCIGLYILITKNHAINFTLKGKINLDIIKEIYKVGLPSIVMQALVSIMIFGMNAILITFSSTAVAVMGIYGKVQSFVFMPCFGVNQGALPIMGYNYGAGDRKRMFHCYKLGIIMSVSIMFAGLLVFQFAPHVLLKMFNASPEMMGIGVTALKRISWCFIPAGFGIITAGLFQATGHGMLSMWGAIIRQFVGTLPFAFIFGKIFGLDMVWFAFAAAEIVGMIYYLIVLKYINEKTFKKMECRNE